MTQMEILYSQGSVTKTVMTRSDDNSGVGGGSLLSYTSNQLSLKFLRVFNKLVATNVNQMNYSIGDNDIDNQNDIP